MKEDQQLEKYHRIAMDNAELAMLALHNGDIQKFHRLSAEALIYEKKAALALYERQIEPSRSVLFQSAAYIALDNADFIEAQKLYEYALEGDPPAEIFDELDELKTEIDRIKTENEGFIQTVTIKLKTQSKPSRESIKAEAQKVLSIFNQREINFHYAIQFLERQFNIDSEKHATLYDEERFEPWIYNKKGLVDKRYWERYKQFLILDEGWAPDTVDKLDNITDDILDHLKDPKTSGDWDKRGMVVGQVQSGKTSNYIGLICKAADYGYRIVIVLAGISNDLRSQTQFRTDSGFLGHDTKIDRSLEEANAEFGVSKYDNRPQAHYLTSSAIDGDFSQASRYIVGVNIKGTDPVVMVVKKNGHVLKELIKWLANTGDTLSDGKRLIKKLPLIIIDDEADNASINIDPTNISTINGLIRSLLSLFQQSAYVGYTATPFANVFIPLPENEDNISRGLNIMLPDFWRYSGEDLFPRDFIINIPPPSNYIGPKEIFGIDSEISIDPDKGEVGLPILKEIYPEEYQQYFPEKHKKSDPLPTDLPESLKRAVKSFILSCAIRRTRGQIKKHNSMLIHVTRYVKWQDRIATLIDRLLKTYQHQIQYKQGEIIPELKKIYEEEYIKTTDEIIAEETDPFIVRHDWAEVMTQLNKSASKIQVRAIHGDKRLEGLTHQNITPLDYYDYRETGLSVIAVGGNKLSRGLTLEGLTISYYLRASKMYDTLMQMGRWFGYRPGYIDVCRLYTSEELIRWYKYITVASEELREEFEEMKSQRKSPKNFGIKVRQHPDVLQITATNKMRSGQEMKLSFSDKLRETWCFPRNPGVVKNNYIRTTNFVDSLGIPATKNGQPYVWYNKNNFNDVINFLRTYTADNSLEHSKIVEYIDEQAKVGYLVNWTIVLISNNRNKKDNLFTIGGKAISVGLTMRSDSEEGKGHFYELNKSHIIDPKHEFLDFDLKSEPYKKALTKTIDDWEISERKNKSPTPPETPTGRNIRAHRSVTEGLLLIYPLDPKPDGWENSSLTNPIIGYAISFPKNDDDKKVTYKVNEVFIAEYDYELDLDSVDAE